MQVLELPVYIAGTQKECADADEHLELDYDGRISVRIPRFTAADLDRVNRQKAAALERLAQLKTVDVTRFLAEVGQAWQAGGLRGRELVERWAPEFTGYPPSMIAMDCRTMGVFLSEPWHTFETIGAEFGSERFLDEWEPRGEFTIVRGFPRGLVLHYLVGNVPLAGMYSVIRSIITRNVTLAKIPSRDPVSALGIVSAMVEVDPEHPVSRSLSAVYYPRDAEISDACLKSADAVCVWGGHDAVSEVKRAAPPGVPVAEYGPRRSLAVIDLDRCDPVRAAYRLAEDVCYYDQEACVNVQRAFVAGDLAAFVPVLGRYLDAFADRHPLVSENPDVLAHRSASILEARFLGWPVVEGRDWAIVLPESVTSVREHPLARVIYLHRVESPAEVGQHLSRDVQTMAVFPWALALEYRDDWARRGVDRFADLGWSRLPRVGWSHDGSYGLHALVRIVELERDSTYLGKYSQVKDTTQWEKIWFATDAVQGSDAAGR